MEYDKPKVTIDLAEYQELNSLKYNLNNDVYKKSIEGFMNKWMLAQTQNGIGRHNQLDENILNCLKESLKENGLKLTAHSSGMGCSIVSIQD